MLLVWLTSSALSSSSPSGGPVRASGRAMNVMASSAPRSERLARTASPPSSNRDSRVSSFQWGSMLASEAATILVLALFTPARKAPLQTGRPAASSFLMHARYLRQMAQSTPGSSSASNDGSNRSAVPRDRQTSM